MAMTQEQRKELMRILKDISRDGCSCCPIRHCAAVTKEEPQDKPKGKVEFGMVDLKDRSGAPVLFSIYINNEEIGLPYLDNGEAQLIAEELRIEIE